MAPQIGPDAWVNAVPVGWCRMRPDDDTDLALRVELGDGFPTVTQGFGGWDTVPRPSTLALTHWAGHDPLSIDLPLWFDNLENGRSVEAAIQTLEGMAGRGLKAKGEIPPRLKVDTAGVMPFDMQDFPDTRWVINGLTYDDDMTLVNSGGRRMRQAITVTLLQHVEDDRLASRSFAVRQKLKKPKGGRYQVKKGETLLTIAAKQLGDASRWREIAVKNGLRDPRSIRAGAVIRLP